MGIRKFNVEEVERKLNYIFQNKKLLKRAFVHTSYAVRKRVGDNERLEFFGDAILDMLVSDYLFKKFPQCDAGDLSMMRSKIVSAEGLRPVVEDLGILDYLIFYGSCVKALSRKIEANLYEAVLCAIYLDGGMDSARNFVMRTLKEKMDTVGYIDK